ncbi:hypothetical protein VTJ83DRAFT_7537 [Remersonia thermophila]|uniref:RRM domain-containing protein n=1 Tax=Remersonia thermophila TaxID=72144 RepID=A0ABR4D3S7_9PEZI
MANPVGEDNWVAYVDQLRRDARDLEACVRVVEAFRRATLAEPGSLKVWMEYCEYFWSLYTDCEHANLPRWSPDEIQMGRETFTFDAALNLWQEGYEAVRYRLDDSHELWNRWISLELDLLRRTATEAGVRRITHLFKDRLTVPHATWDATSQMFSSFLSEYNRHGYETEMQRVTQDAKQAKRLYDLRDPWETKLAAARRAADPDAVRNVLSEYLEWEIRTLKSKQNARDAPVNFQICLGLFARALTGPLAADDSTWLDYAVFISTTHSELKAGRSAVPAALVPNMLDLLQRAVRHVPWSGPLWARYILIAEEAGLQFTDIETIKHAATDSAQLDRDGMAGVLDMYAAWCGYLKRSAMKASATEEEVDVAEVGLPAAIEDVQHWGKRKYGDQYQGDPDYRLEKILIQFLTEKKDDVEGAREVWEELSRVPLHANSYDFWLNWYLWEMMVFSAARSKSRSPVPLSQGLPVPTHATRVFTRALQVRTVDWPERLMEVYLRHCNDYEPAETLREAHDTIYKTRKGVAKRRAREAAQAVQAAQEAAAAETTDGAGAQAEDQPMTDADGVSSASPGSKRKREQTLDVEEDAAGHKRAKSEALPGDEPKRDRENTSVWLTDLPADITQTKIKQFLQGYGRIVNIDVKKGDDSAVALVELGSPDDARSALLRDGRYLGQNVVRVSAATDCTLFVTNYPPEADEQFLRGLFDKCGEIFGVRFPSLKYNTKRRFCYVTFRTRDAAAAATKLDGKSLESGKYRLVAKFSDPAARQQRHGAQAEERELHVVNLPRSMSEDDVRGIFSKAGRVVSVRLPRTMAGHSTGTAFIVMETREEAKEAIRTLGGFVFGQHPIKVELSRPPVAKTTATTRASRLSTMSPEPGPSGSSTSTPPPPAPADIAARTIAVLNVPDTMTDARLRTVLATAGVPVDEAVKFVLHPKHGGAVIEFATQAAAGKASLVVDGIEVDASTGLGDGSDGTGKRKLKIATVQELFKAKAEKRVDRIDKPSALGASSSASSGPGSGGSTSNNGVNPADASTPATSMQPPALSVRRPVVGKGGPKRLLGFVGARKDAGSGSGSGATGLTNGDVPAKNNADFRKLFLNSGSDGVGSSSSAAREVDGKEENNHGG